MKPSDFKVGDRVRFDCIGTGISHFHGLTGTVTLTTEDFVGCRVDAAYCVQKEYWFYPCQCQPLIDSLLSPQSPQPQTTQQKEDTVKPYAVIYQNLVGTTPSTITGQFTTEAEAKEYAEQTVAGQRANLTTKQYFAVTIVNTKTGKLIGSVVDAPPAVDWAS